jgi:hypothetical protein
VHGIGEPHAIRSGAEANLLLHLRGIVSGRAEDDALAKPGTPRARRREKLRPSAGARFSRNATNPEFHRLRRDWKSGIYRSVDVLEAIAKTSAGPRLRGRDLRRRARR